MLASGRYRAMGLLIGSGVVESSCGTLVAARFKRGGMRWSKASANDILPCAPASAAACTTTSGASGADRRLPLPSGWRTKTSHIPPR